MLSLTFRRGVVLSCCVDERCIGKKNHLVRRQIEIKRKMYALRCKYKHIRTRCLRARELCNNGRCPPVKFHWLHEWKCIYVRRTRNHCRQSLITPVCVCVKVDRPQWHYTSCTIDYHRQQFSDIHDYVYYYVYLVRHMCVCARARERAHEISLKIIIIVLYIKRRILRGIGAWTTIKRDEEYYKNVALVHRWKSSSYVYYDGLFIEVVSFSLRLFRYVMYVFFCTTIHFLILLYSFCLANVRVNEARPIRKY